jgi:signal transduction histidine kinase
LEQLATIAFLFFATASLWLWVTWTINHPLDRFARAAERVGVDVHSPPLAVHGPLQLQRAIHAFNEMQVRLQRLLTDRTLMLGAISHDLGTPLTRLRLRVETDRANDKTKMLADIEAMQIMLTSALSFVRGVDDAEPREVVDLDSLLQTVCDLVSDLGGDVSYGAPTHANYYCKPQAMLRAFTNLVTNAAKYGEHAWVSLQAITDTGFVVEIQDDGPGIPDSEKAKVFEPFYRTDEARKSDRQGLGLGLSIARSIILAHGGVIELRDREPHGLNVHIFLPSSRTVL